jgi:hypothetical protein
MGLQLAASGAIGIMILIVVVYFDVRPLEHLPKWHQVAFGVLFFGNLLVTIVGLYMAIWNI